MNASHPKPSHWAEWVLLRGLITLIRQGEIAAACRKAHWLARLGRHLFRSEWAWANANLALIYGSNLTLAERQKLAAITFENIFLSYMEAIRVHDIQFQNEGTERLQEVHSLGHGVILCSIHLGCWEPGLIHCAKMISPMAILYRPANNPLSEKTFMELRADYGVEWIARQNTRDIVRALQANKVLGFMVDINTREGGVTAPFLGMTAQCPPGPARLALRYKKPVLPVIAIRKGPGQALFRVGEVIEPQAGEENDERIAALTARINASFAPWVHEFAEQYNWLHARWRARPDGRLWRPDDAKAANQNPAVPSQRVMKLLK